MKKFIKIMSAVLAIMALATCAVSCGATGKAKYDASITGEGTDVRMSVVANEINKYKVSDFEASKQKSDYVLIKIQNYGEIVVALRSDIAPITVDNFKSLVSSKYYEGTAFHRVIESFMIQGGGYNYINGKLTQKDDVATIKGEFTSNGVTNNLAHIRGVISMARTSVPDSASSQFFIMHQASESLDREYAAFGYVLAGMEVVDAIATCECEGDAQAPVPVNPVVIESITFVQPK